MVVGTGVNGRIVVGYPDAQLCGVLTVPATDAVLGGDMYALSTQGIALSQGANKTSADLTIYISGSELFATAARILGVNSSQVLYARLVFESISAPPTLNLDIWLEGATRSTNVSIRNGVPVLASTSTVQLNLELGNTEHLSGYFTSTNQAAVLNLKLELCTMPEAWVHVYIIPLCLK